VAVVRGNAATPAVLRQARLERARELVVAVPDPLVTRQVVDQARAINPRLRIIARTHSEAERAWLLARGVDSVILGEWELALEMAVHALRGFGVGSMEAEAVVQRLRGQGDPAQVRDELTRPVAPKAAPAEAVAAAEPGGHPQRRLHDGLRFREQPSPTPRGEDPEAV
jgi:voltage-gated potassium channel Kch